MDFRLYFNRRREFPFVWSVDSGPGTQEFKVKDFKLHRITGNGRFEPSMGDDKDTPTAWVEITFAVLEIKADVAHFFRNYGWRQPPLRG